MGGLGGGGDVYAYFVTPSKIRSYGSSEYYRASLLPWTIGDRTVQTPRATEIIALMPELRALDGEHLRCSGYSDDLPTSVEGLLDGKRFTFSVYGIGSCEDASSPTLMRLKNLIDSVSEVEASLTKTPG